MADDYFDLSNRHEIYLGRTATHLANEYPFKSLTESYKAARAILIESGDITSITKLNKITAKIASELNSGMLLMWPKLTTELEELAANEAAFSAKTIGEFNDVALTVPADSAIVSAVNKTLMTLTSGQNVNSGVWAEYTKANTSSVIKAYNSQIKAGYSNGETLSQITKRLRTVTNGILKNNAEALVRTGVSHYAVNGKNAMAQANRDVIKNKYFNSVFDNRRTLICSHFAENPVYAMDDKTAPILPLHFNERSNWLYLVGDQKHPFGTRAAVGGQKSEAAKERYEKRENALDKRRANENITGKTSSKVKYRGRKDGDTFEAGQIKGSTGSDAWMRSQPAWFQDSALGPARGKLFREGLKLGKFSDFTGRKLTLKELKDSGV